jgi:tRNA/tmRNA/rRNA uracil-C5-methylase (TrmA/RlmC/RlmD family)
MLEKEKEMEELKYSSKAMPTRLCTDPKFKYRNSSQTDVRRTWRKAKLIMFMQRGDSK